MSTIKFCEWTRCYYYYTIFDYPLQDDISAGLIFAKLYILFLNTYAKAEQSRLALIVSTFIRDVQISILRQDTK